MSEFILTAVLRAADAGFTSTIRKAAQQLNKIERGLSGVKSTGIQAKVGVEGAEKIERLKRTMQQMGMSTKAIDVRLNDMATSKVDSLRSKLSSLTSKSYNVAVNMTANGNKAFNAATGKVSSAMGGAAMAAGLGVSALGATAVGYTAANAVQTYMDFEYQMKRNKALFTTGMDAEEAEKQYKALEEAARHYGSTMIYTATEVGKAQEYMALAGWDVPTAIAALPSILKAAVASGEDLALVSDIITDDMTAMGYKAGEMIKNAKGEWVESAAHFTDVMLRTTLRSNTDFRKLGLSMKYVAPLAHTYGAKIEELAVVLGTLANNGIKADQAGTAVRGILTRLAAPTKQSAAAIEQLGIAFDRGDGNALGLLNTLMQIRDKFQGAGNVNQMLDFMEQFTGEEIQNKNEISEFLLDAQARGGLGNIDKSKFAKMMAGQYALAGFLAFMNAKDEDLKKLINEVYNMSDGTTELINAEMMNTFKGDLKTLISAWEDFNFELLNGKGAEGFRSFIQGLTKDINSFKTAIKDGLDFKDVGGLAMDVLTQLRHKFIELDGVGSLLAGGALMTGMYAIMRAGVGVYDTLKKWSKVKNASDLANVLRGNTTSQMGGMTSQAASVSTMNVRAGVVNLTGKINGGTSQIGGGTSQHGGTVIGGGGSPVRGNVPPSLRYSYQQAATLQSRYPTKTATSPIAATKTVTAPAKVVPPAPPLATLGTPFNLQMFSAGTPKKLSAKAIKNAEAAGIVLPENVKPVRGKKSNIILPGKAVGNSKAKIITSLQNLNPKGSAKNIIQPNKPNQRNINPNAQIDLPNRGPDTSKDFIIQRKTNPFLEPHRYQGPTPSIIKGTAYKDASDTLRELQKIAHRYVSPISKPVAKPTKVDLRKVIPTRPSLAELIPYVNRTVSESPQYPYWLQQHVAQVRAQNNLPVANTNNGLVRLAEANALASVLLKDFKPALPLSPKQLLLPAPSKFIIPQSALQQAAQYPQNPQTPSTILPKDLSAIYSASRVPSVPSPQPVVVPSSQPVVVPSPQSVLAQTQPRENKSIEELRKLAKSGAMSLKRELLRTRYAKNENILEERARKAAGLPPPITLKRQLDVLPMGRNASISMKPETFDMQLERYYSTLRKQDLQTAMANFEKVTSPKPKPLVTLASLEEAMSRNITSPLPITPSTLQSGAPNIGQASIRQVSSPLLLPQWSQSTLDKQKKMQEKMLRTTTDEELRKSQTPILLQSSSELKAFHKHMESVKKSLQMPSVKLLPEASFLDWPHEVISTPEQAKNFKLSTTPTPHTPISLPAIATQRRNTNNLPFFLTSDVHVMPNRDELLQQRKAFFDKLEYQQSNVVAMRDNYAKIKQQQALEEKLAAEQARIERNSNMKTAGLTSGIMAGAFAAMDVYQTHQYTTGTLEEAKTTVAYQKQVLKNMQEQGRDSEVIEAQLKEVADAEAYLQRTMEMNKRVEGRAEASAAGSVIGSVLGAALGSLLPGVGTMVGGMVGGMAGGTIGQIAGSELYQATVEHDGKILTHNVKEIEYEKPLKNAKGSYEHKNDKRNDRSGIYPDQVLRGANNVQGLQRHAIQYPKKGSAADLAKDNHTYTPKFKLSQGPLDLSGKTTDELRKMAEYRWEGFKYYDDQERKPNLPSYAAIQGASEAVVDTRVDPQRLHDEYNQIQQEYQKRLTEDKGKEAKEYFDNLFDGLFNNDKVPPIGEQGVQYQSDENLSKGVYEWFRNSVAEFWQGVHETASAEYQANNNFGNVKDNGVSESNLQASMQKMQEYSAALSEFKSKAEDALSGTLDLLETFVNPSRLLGGFFVEDSAEFGLSNLKEMFSVDMADIEALVDEGLVNVSEGFISTFGDIPAQISGGLESARNSIVTSLTTASLEVQAVWNAMPGFFSGIFGGLGGIATAAGYAIASGINSGIGTIQSAWEALSGWLSAKISSLASMASEAASMIGINVDSNYKGTSNFAGGWTEINEHGGELIYLPTGTRIVPHATTKSILRHEIRNRLDDGENIEIPHHYIGTSFFRSNVQTLPDESKGKPIPYTAKRPPLTSAPISIPKTRKIGMRSWGKDWKNILPAIKDILHPKKLDPTSLIMHQNSTSGATQTGKAIPHTMKRPPLTSEPFKFPQSRKIGMRSWGKDWKNILPAIKDILHPKKLDPTSLIMHQNSDTLTKAEQLRIYQQQRRDSILNGTKITVLPIPENQRVSDINRENQLEYFKMPREDELGNLQGIDIPEYNRITADDSIMVMKAKRQAQLEQLRNMSAETISQPFESWQPPTVRLPQVSDGTTNNSNSNTTNNQNSNVSFNFGGVTINNGNDLDSLMYQLNTLFKGASTNSVAG